MVIGRTVRVSRPSMRGLAVEDLVAHDLGFDRKTKVLHGVHVRAAFGARADRFEHAFPDGVDRLRTGALLAHRERLAQVGFRHLGDLRGQGFVPGGGFPVPGGLAATSASSSMAVIAACICSWPCTTAPSITSSGSSSASDSTISTPWAVPATTRFSFDSLICDASG
jgi:hypothetical protein